MWNIIPLFQLFQLDNIWISPNEISPKNITCFNSLEYVFEESSIRFVLIKYWINLSNGTDIHSIIIWNLHSKTLEIASYDIRVFLIPTITYSLK